MNNKKKKIPFFLRLFDPKMFFYDFVKFTGALPVLADLRVKKIYAAGKKPKGIFRGKYIISSNHMSYSDPIILSDVFWQRRVGFVATNEFFRNPFWDKFFRGVGCIPVDKKNPSLATFKAVVERLDRGHVVCVFPEGEVTRTENMGAFKSGVVMMAVMAKAEILPVFLVKRKNRFKRQIAVIGEKIDYRKYIEGRMPTVDDLNAVTGLLVEKERALEELYKSTIKETKA